ncbi:Gag-pol fusion protein [Phytophthora palmivora]|uniref:Gag-pol fusion protein n=1 Tax=Phytophthora palmivora TaxID=4796 RepID=A0A2P4YN71_9STRA|nr:Gag-pol fusion protein [Phytophthora palmivora]
MAYLVGATEDSGNQSTRKIAGPTPVRTLELWPYRLPVKEGSKPSAQSHIQSPELEEVKRLGKLGVLKPGKNSPWAAPSFVIPKKDGSYYPLNKIQDLIRELPQPTFVSALDLVMGYYSQVLAEESRPFTAVVLPWRKFRYCLLPMGISTAPEEFHAVMQQLLGDLSYVRVYLDDVLVLSRSSDEHMCHPEVVFGRLLDAGLVV